MGVPLLGAVRDLLTARAEIAQVRSAAAILTALLGLAAATLVCAAGLVALSDIAGFPIAALVVAALLSVSALAVSLLARRHLLAKRTKVLDAQIRMENDLALATSLTRSARPLLPLAVFLAVFLFARRP